MKEGLLKEQLGDLCPHGNFPTNCKTCSKSNPDNSILASEINQKDIYLPDYLDGSYVKLCEKKHGEISDLTNEIVKLCPQLADDMPKIEAIPPDFINYPEEWLELDNNQKSYQYQKHISQIRIQLLQIKRQIENIKEFISTGNDKPFTGSPAACANFWVDTNPTIRRYLYDIIKPQIPECKTVNHIVRHSIDYTVTMLDVGWKKRLNYLAKYPGYREESCYSQGKPPGDVVLEVDAEVREAYPFDVGATVNPYTGEKVYSNKDKINNDPETYFANKPDFIKGLHSHSDELFARFDIHKDLKRVIVYDTRLIPEVQKILSKKGIKASVEFESSETKNNQTI